MLFDTHVHLDFLPDRTVQVAAARGGGVHNFLAPGVQPSDWPALLAAVDDTDGALAAPGVHPLAAESWNEAVAATLNEMMQRPGVVALGEIGLDAKIAVAPERQEQVFRAQLRIAVASGRPVLLHCRRATGRLLQLLAEEEAGRVGGILHAFTGSLETARAAIRLGFAVGIGGPVTWPEAERLAGVVRALPADWVVLETDAPDLAPHPHRGEANRPDWLPLIAQRLADLRGWTPDETATITTRNARRILRLPDEESA